MAPLEQMPAEKVRDFIRDLIDGARPREQGMIVAARSACLSLEQARSLWWAAKWLELIAEGPVQDTDFSIDYCRRYLLEKVEKMKGQDGEEKVLSQDRRGIKILIDVEQHLDNWVLAKGFDELKRSRGEFEKKRNYGRRKP